jgi:hypothetical protein
VGTMLKPGCLCALQANAVACPILRVFFRESKVRDVTAE